jgi:hypothetical protein
MSLGRIEQLVGRLVERAAAQRHQHTRRSVHVHNELLFPQFGISNAVGEEITAVQQ